MLPVYAFYLFWGGGGNLLGFICFLIIFNSSDKNLGLFNAAIQHALKKERVTVLLSVRPCYCFTA